MGSTTYVPPCPNQVFVRALRVDYGLDQFVIDYSHIGDSIGNSMVTNSMGYRGHDDTWQRGF